MPEIESPSMNDSAPLVLVTGVTGYIGGRLAPRLIEAGYRVRVLARDPSRLSGRPWVSSVEIAAGDALKPGALEEAMRGVKAAFFLLHSQRGGADFLERNLRAASQFGQAARAAGLEQIIFLGGLGEASNDRSGLVASQRRTAEVLRQSGVPLTEFRSSPVIGSGSVQFEIIRYITERSPLFFCPKWLFTAIQPIAIRDLLTFLILAVGTPECRGRVVDIGGPDITTVLMMMMTYAKVRKLRRLTIPLPWLIPRISSYWVHVMTPIPIDLARTRIEGLRRPALVENPDAEEIFGPMPRMNYETVLRRALELMERGEVETTWADSLASSLGDQPPSGLEFQEGLILVHRQRWTTASPPEIFRVFSSLGGDKGWFYMDWAWRFRAWLDRITGGVGKERGRRHPQDVRPGDVIDFWRVETVEEGRLLRLRAEMRMFGLGWLEFTALPGESGRTRLLVTAYYLPKGFLGILYWLILYPVHAAIFSGLARAICRNAEASAGSVAA
jgi:uncharacterized protein YbjT (DUF2867 family)